MGFDASGTYVRWNGPDTWKKDAAAGTKILSTNHDDHDADLGNALSDCLNRKGNGGALSDISWGGFKITNLGQGTDPGDVATVGYVNAPGPQTGPKNMSGADANGRLNFTAPSGVNGITWTYVDVSWIARHSVTSKYGNRLAMNNSVAPNTTGDPVGDVFFIDDAGRVNNSGVLSSNLSYDGGAWRTISPGTGTLVTYSGGDFSLLSNDVASVTNPYAAVTLRNFFGVNNGGGSVQTTINKSASGKYAALYGQMGGVNRWLIYLGDATAETGGPIGRGGSDFSIYSYVNNAASATRELHIDRETHKWTTTGDLQTGGQITSANHFDSLAAVSIYSAGGQIVISPQGPTSTTSQTDFLSTGEIQVCKADVTPSGGIAAGKGIRGKVGSAGAYDTEYMNFTWNGSNLIAYANTLSLGNVTTSCDYRIKKDIVPLRSTWNLVKALKPVRYTQKAYEIWVNDDTPRWGFVAHELQEALGPHAASGVKDGPDVQSPNLMGIIAGLTKALQEAMARIEALEAAA